MKVITEGAMPDGVAIQIEDWHETYSFIPYANTLAAYPVSKVNLEGYFAPRQKERFRCTFNFELAEDAQEAFDRLTAGTAVLADYTKNLSNPRHSQCI